MERTMLQSRQGYAIPCVSHWQGERTVLLVCHGFGSSKESPMVQALNREMPRCGVGVVSFDFPAHGESPVGQEGLRVPYCVADLAAVEESVRRIDPTVRIGYFGSSFGAYITLLYLSLCPHRGEKALLRSSAVAMPSLVDTWVDDRARADLSRQGYFVPDYDYVREMRITPAFLRDLAEYDVFQRYRPGAAELYMVHGAKDSVAPPAAAERFARQFGAELRMLPNGEHNLMGEGELEQVLAFAREVFSASEA